MLRAFYSTVGYIINHPMNQKDIWSALFRYFRWQIGSRILGFPVLVPFGQRSRLIVRTGMAGATQNIYCGLDEFEDMAFVMHMLGHKDYFVDVGANIGSYTVLAAEAGADCLTFEPAPSTFEALRDNVEINHLVDRVELWNAGVGAKNASLRFTTGNGTMNHVLAEGEQGEAVDVPIVRLDDVVKRVPVVMKIDVEGFEIQVVEGAKATLAAPELLAVVMELNGSGKRYGFQDADLRKAMEDLGFVAFAYKPFDRSLVELQEPSTRGNTLFIRSPEAVLARLRSASPTTINGMSF